MVAVLIGVWFALRADLVYRDFTCIGGGKVPDAKTMGRWGVALWPAMLRQVW